MSQKLHVDGFEWRNNKGRILEVDVDYQETTEGTERSVIYHSYRNNKDW